MPPRAAPPTVSAPSASPPNADVDDLMDLDNDLDDSDSRTATSTSALLAGSNSPESLAPQSAGGRRSGLPRSASASSAALGLGDAEDSDGGDDGSMLFDEGEGEGDGDEEDAEQHQDRRDYDLDPDQGDDDDDDDDDDGMMDGQVDMDDEDGDMTGGEDMDLGEDDEDAESTMVKSRRSALADASRAQRASSQSEDDGSGSDDDDDDERSDMDIDPTDTDTGADKDASAAASPPGSPSSAKGSPTLAPLPDSTPASPSNATDSAPPLPMPRRASRPATRRSSVSTNMDEALAQSLPLSPRLAAAAIAAAAANVAAGLSSPKSVPATILAVDVKQQNGLDVDLDPADYADRADEGSDSEDEGSVDVGKSARGKAVDGTTHGSAGADQKDMELEGVVPVIAKAAQTKLMSIEQDFNGIRDELFEKRWEFLEVEEEQIRNGTHPAYIENMKAAQAAHDERVARATALYQYQTKSAQAYFDYAKHEGEKTFEDMRWRLKLERIREAQRTLFQLKAERRKLRPRAPNSQSMDPFIDQSLSISGSATTRYFLTRRRKRNKQLAADMRVVQAQFGFPVLGPDTLHIQDITHDLDFLRRTNAQRRAALRPPPPPGHPYPALPHHPGPPASSSSRGRHGLPPPPMSSSWQQQPQPQPRGSAGHQQQPMHGYYQNQHGQLVPMGHQGQPAMPLPAYHQQQQMMAHAQRRPTPAPPSSANGPVRPPMAQDNPNNVVRCSQDKLHYYGRDVMYNDMAVLREAATGAQYQARYVGIQGDDTLWIKPEGSRKRIPMLSLTSGEYLIVSDNGMAGAQPSSGVHVPPPTTLPPLSSVANGSAPQAQQQQWLGPSQAPPAASSAVRHGPVVGSA